MAKTKTTFSDASITDFIDDFVTSEQKKQDSYQLISLMQSVSGFPPKMWGPSIIGFGRYHYKYASGHEGDAPLIGFSPRKAAISLYVYMGGKPDQDELLTRLGKFKMGKACIYANKLSDINLDVLTALMKSSIQHLETEYEKPAN